jgi:hypothetical protein
MAEHRVWAGVKERRREIGLNRPAAVANGIDVGEDAVQVSAVQPVLDRPVIDPSGGQLRAANSAELTASDPGDNNFGVRGDDGSPPSP